MICLMSYVLCLNSVLNVKAVVAALNQEKALVGAFSVITNLRMELFEALVVIPQPVNMTQYNWSLQAAASQVIIGPCYRNTHPANFLLRSRILDENMRKIEINCQYSGA